MPPVFPPLNSLNCPQILAVRLHSCFPIGVFLGEMLQVTKNLTIYGTRGAHMPPVLRIVSIATTVQMGFSNQTGTWFVHFANPAELMDWVSSILDAESRELCRVQLQIELHCRGV